MTKMRSIGFVALACGMSFAALAGDVVLFDAATARPADVRGQDGGTFALKDGLLTVTTPASDAYPGVAVRGDWDLSDCGQIEVEFVDGGIHGQYTLRLLNADGVPAGAGSFIAKLPIGGEKHKVCTQVFPPALTNWNAIAQKLTRVRTWALPYMIWQPIPPEGDNAWGARPKGVRVDQLDRASVKEVAVYINTPRRPHTWRVKRIVATGEPMRTQDVPAFARMTPDAFFPFIDVYGQFKHREWPDKVHSDADFAVQREKEAKDLAAHPGPKGWDKWGGWADGPQLPKTGGFTTTKWNGKWWIVDPDGHLWWSHGPVRVTPSSATTALDGHDDWFENLPAKDAPDAEFYSTHDQLLFPYYARWKMHRIYDFSARNIARKYGKGWYDTWADLAHRRLRSWGCNTIANSSDKKICLMDRTPYTDRFEIHSRPIAGHKGGWWDFCDPFDPSFRAEARRQTEIHRDVMQDPWCFGLFVDNEHHWGAAHSLALSTLKSPADQPCKKVFRDRLQAKYGDVAKLNAQWKTQYADWDAVLASTDAPALDGAKADLEAFSMEIAEAYYRIIREELKRAAPGKLYMGCRWAGSSPPAFTVRAAAKYCDVLSYNIYTRHLRGFKLPDGVDKPVLIGEFHFGALDRGPFCPGLLLLKDQAERAEVYQDYVRSALEHPLFVGVHWHQFSDQATSGRFDGENMQVGWTDVCDTPYWETIAGIREIGSQLYSIRAKDGAAAAKAKPARAKVVAFKDADKITSWDAWADNGKMPTALKSSLEREKPCPTWKKLNALKFDGLREIGRLPTRTAAEIKSSPWSIGCETMDRDYADWNSYKFLLPMLGAKHGRLFSGWAKTEQEKGVYDFTWLDPQVREMAAMGVKPWICLSYGNPVWGSDFRLGMRVKQVTDDPEAFAAWIRYCEACVRRYMDVVDEWEIWNEPFGQGPEYAEMFYRTGKAIRAIQPTAKLYCTAINYPKDYTTVLERLKKENALDLGSRFIYHPYWGNPDDSYAGLAEPLRKLVKSYSPAFDVYQGEVGCPSQLEFAHALANIEWTEYSQAKWNLRRTIGDAARSIPSSVFTMVDLKYTFMLQSFGLVRSNLLKEFVYRRPSFYAMQNVFNYFDDETRPVKLVTAAGFTVERRADPRDTAGRRLTCAKFERKGKPSWCYWYANRTPSNVLEFDRVTLAIPGRIENPVWIEMITGRMFEIPADCVSVANGAAAQGADSSAPVTTLRNVPMWDSPVMITEKSAFVQP